MEQTSIQKIQSRDGQIRILHLIENCSIVYTNASSQWAKDYWLMTKTILQRRYQDVLQKVN